jgi:hypothetical protein
LDERRTNQGRSDGNVVACNAATTMALQLTTLLLLRLYCCCGVAATTLLLLRLYCYCGAATATLLLERAMALLLVRRCYCNVVVGAHYGTAIATLLLQRVTVLLM